VVKIGVANSYFDPNHVSAWLDTAFSHSLPPGAR